MTPRWTPLTLGAVFLGGFLGSVTRWWLQTAFGGTDLSNAAVTLLVNTAGVFLMSWAAPLAARWTAARRAFLTTGFFGGLTTFSAVMLFLVRPQEIASTLGWGFPGAPLLAGLGYFLLSLAAAWVAASLGSRAAQRASHP